MAISALLHGAVLLLALLLWTLARAPSPPPSGPQPIPVDLVEEGPETISPDGQKSKLPQERATETAEHPQPQAVPVPKQASPVKAPGKQAPHKDQDHSQPDPHGTPSPQPQEGDGISNTTTGANGTLNGHAAYGVKDYVRAQIERRWYPKGSALLRNDWVVQLHLQLDENGSVEKAEIVDGGKMGDAAYRDFAFSVRNAAVLSAPFALPPGLDEAARDMTLNFNPRQVQQ
jgi:outer membrane biosynthesis protein TonB